MRSVLSIFALLLALLALLSVAPTAEAASAKSRAVRSARVSRFAQFHRHRGIAVNRVRVNSLHLNSFSRRVLVQDDALLLDDACHTSTLALAPVPLRPVVSAIAFVADRFLSRGFYGNSFRLRDHR